MDRMGSCVVTLCTTYRDALKGGPVLLSNSQASSNFPQPSAALLKPWHILHDYGIHVVRYQLSRNLTTRPTDSPCCASAFRFRVPLRLLPLFGLRRRRRLSLLPLVVSRLLRGGDEGGVRGGKRELVRLQLRQNLRHQLVALLLRCGSIINDLMRLRVWKPYVFCNIRLLYSNPLT